jgi:xeroderma pigmentosum group C-complementing protein
VTRSENEEDGEEVEEDWEEVDLGQDAALADDVAETGDLEIVLGAPRVMAPRRRRGRLPATVEERRKRLTMHKIHILCLLYHGFLRNHWCNDRSLQVVSESMKRIS